MMMLTIRKGVHATVLAVALLAVPAGFEALPALPGTAAVQPPAQEGFVPVEDLHGQEQMPAAPLVAAAYGVAWAAVLVYVFSLWRRLGTVEREMAEVSRRIAARERS
jgi:CcmD family protein